MITKNKFLSKKGFTLIELLVVTAIIGVLAIISATVFNSILRSQNKTTIVNEIRQNGNLVIDKFERDIRGASNVSLAGSVLTVTTEDANHEWDCSTASELLRDGSSLLNQDMRGGVKVKTASCSFSVTTSSPQLVHFEFSLEQRNIADKSEFKSEGEFRTSISTRNYQ